MGDDVLQVGTAIERLNEAIDTVNRLEDEHQAWTKARAAKHATMLCHLRALESEALSLDLVAALNDASRITSRAHKQMSLTEETLVQLQTDQARKQTELASAGLWQARIDLNAQLTEIKAALAAAQK